MPITLGAGHFGAHRSLPRGPEQIVLDRAGQGRQGRQPEQVSRPDVCFRRSTRTVAAFSWARKLRLAAAFTMATTMVGAYFGSTVSTMSPPAAMNRVARWPTGTELTATALLTSSVIATP